MKTMKILCYLLIVLLATGCSSVVSMSGRKMDKVQLGMTRKQVIGILGEGYTVAGKRMEEGALIEVLSYKDFFLDAEYYLFQFRENRLEKWHRELVPRYDTNHLRGNTIQDR